MTVVDDTALHGTVANPDLEGIDANERSLMVIQGHQFAFLHDNGCTAKNLLERTLQIGEIFHSSGARIYSFRSRSNVRTSQLSRVPAGSAGTRQRPPAVAGSFCPSDPVMLDDMTTRLLGPVENRIQTHRFPGAMVPHAALRFSGQIAADTLKRIDFPSRILILCPHHTGRGVSCAVAPHLSWGLPGNPVDSDGDMARSLSHAIPGFKLDAAAHEREHAIEVQLPLIRKLAPTAKVVGVTIGHQPLETLRGYGISLAEWLEKLEDPPLLLISSDMNHFDQDERNRELDAFALDAMETLDPDQLYRSVTSRSISMCGMAPAVIILHALKKLGLLNRMIRTGYGTSAETTGDQSRVVGYAGALFE